MRSRGHTYPIQRIRCLNLCARSRPHRVCRSPADRDDFFATLMREQPMDGRQRSEEKPGRGRRLGFLAAVVAVCAFLYVIDWDFLSSQFTAYRVACEAVVVGNE